MFICTHCGEISAQNWKRAGNAAAFAIGHISTNRTFHIRTIRWGLLHAQYEKRIDEEIRACLILVETAERKRPQLVPKELREKRQRRYEENTPLPRDDTL